MGWYVKPSPTLDFMHKLANDPDTMRRFKEDHKATMDAEGLTPEQQAVITTGDKEHLLNSILEDGRAGG